jgi:hypothetical protein
MATMTHAGSNTESGSDAGPGARIRATGSALARILSGAAAQCLFMTALGGVAAWASYVHVLSIHWSPLAVPGGFLIGMLLLVMGAVMTGSRTHGFCLLLGWYLVALHPIAPFWNTCFADGALAHLGWPAEGLAAMLLALPAFLAPRRWPALGIPVAMVLDALPWPLGVIGISSPLLGAGALLPGMGFLAITWTLAFFALAAVRGKPFERYARIAQILMFNLGVYLTVATPFPSTPIGAWGMVSHAGEVPRLTLDPFYAYQDQFKGPILAALPEGAHLVLTPEGVDPHWNEDQAFYWSNVALAAQQRHATVLLGVYRREPGHPRTLQDGLTDLATGAFYPGRMPVPVSMWRPWARSTHGSFAMSLSRRLIPTPYGKAAYLICYEENLLWPLALQEMHLQVSARPVLLLDSANLWFARGGLGRVQRRSAHMQARLWGLPLVRAVNHPEMRS